MEKPVRWRLHLSEFEFDIIHRAGIKHQAVDALSQLKTKGVDTMPLQNEVPVLTISLLSHNTFPYMMITSTNLSKKHRIILSHSSLTS